MSTAISDRIISSFKRDLPAANPARATTTVSAIDALAQAKVGYFSTLDAYRARGIKASDYLGPIWAANLDLHLVPHIRNCGSVKEAIGYLNDKAFYDFSVAEPYLTPSIDWRLDFLRRTHGCEIDQLPAEMCESPLVLSKHCKKFGDRLLSSDFLNRLAWVYRLQGTLDFPKTPFSIMEIGGGFGALARVFKLIYSQARVVLIDIPESLFFQHAFLKESFPHARHQYISSPDEKITDADFVYVPNCFSAVVNKEDFFLAVNTNSFGEMPEKASTDWINVVQNSTSTKNIFFLNRFLNRIDKNLLATREGHSSWSFALDERWTMREWEVDPDYERCPYFQTTLTRNLHVVASRNATSDSELALLTARAQDIQLEDWNRRPGWDNYVLVSGATYPPMMSRGDLDLTPDLRKTGTLYALWSLVRLTGEARWIELLITYLDYLNGQQMQLFFEEIPTLAKMHAANR
jgi:hypothetical protein